MGRILSYIVKNKTFAATTENSSAHAWYLTFGDGILSHWYDKVQNKGHLRPVSALNKEDKQNYKMENDRI